MGLEKSGWKFTIPEFIDDGEDSLIITFPDGQVKYVPERTCKVRWKHIGGDVAAGYCECGLELDRLHDYEPAHLPNFCPNCGRKVVE